MLHTETKRGPARTIRLRCRCRCGQEFSADRYRVLKGRIKSCGCLRQSGHGVCTPTHRRSQSSEYRTWAAMKRRCYLPTDGSFDRYGARGIAVCDRWRESFANFYDDMGPRPSRNHSIERRDNNGPYAPQNCHWATPKEQANNRRSSHTITLGEKTATVAQWSAITGISAAVIYARQKLGWDVPRTLLTPVRHMNRH